MSVKFKILFGLFLAVWISASANPVKLKETWRNPEAPAVV